MLKIQYPVLAGKMAERGVTKKVAAEALNITPRSLKNKLTGRSEFTWNQVITLQSRFFPDVTKEALMRREGA